MKSNLIAALFLLFQILIIITTINAQLETDKNDDDYFEAPVTNLTDTKITSAASLLLSTSSLLKLTLLLIGFKLN